MKSFFLFVFTFFFLWSAAVRADLIQQSEIEPESREAVLASYLKKADTVLLVCAYEARYTPIPRGGGLVWDRACQCRVVKSLRGKVPMGSLLNLHRKAESLPDAGTVRTEGSVRFIASPVQGALWYVFLDSSKLAKQQNNQYEYFLDTMWLNPLAWSNEEGMMAFRKLMRVEEGCLVEESDAVRMRKKQNYIE